MAKTRTAKHPAPKTAEPEPQPEPRPAPKPEPEKAVSKADAVRAALAHGMEKPDDGVAYIKAKFGIDLPKPMWSSYRAQIRARENRSEGQAPKRGRKTKAVVQGYLVPPKIVPTGEGDLINVMEAMKPLVASLGAEKVKRIVDLLA